MKAMKIFLAGVMLFGGMQAKAGGDECEYSKALGMYLMLTFTSAPTGTTMLTDAQNRCNNDALIHLKGEVVTYQLKGEIGPLMRSSIEQVQSSSQGQMSEEAIVRHLVDSVM